MGKRAYPLRNKNLCKVFCSIANGKNKISEISKQLRLDRTATYQYIKILKNIIIISRAQGIKYNLLIDKEKRKGFGIDWEIFYKFFLFKWITDKYEETIQDAENSEDKESIRDINNIRKIIRSNKVIFKNLINNYIKNFAKEWIDKENEIDFTIDDMMHDFDIAQILLMNRYKSKGKSRNQKILIKSLIKLQDIYLKRTYPASRAFDISFGKLK